MAKKIKKTEVRYVDNIKSTSNTSNIVIENVEGYLKEFLYFKDYFDDKKFNKFLKKTEYLIRHSDSYKSFIGACHSKGLDKCAILGNVKIGKKTNIEIHHYPFTLYDIVMLCVQKHIKNNDNYTSITIAKEILQDHHDGLISVVPLCKTIHQLVHDGVIFISLNSCYGNFDNEFFDKYECVMDNELKKNYNKLVQMTKKGIVYNEFDILKKVEEYEKLSTNKLDEEIVLEEDNNEKTLIDKKTKQNKRKKSKSKINNKFLDIEDE